MSAPAWRSQPRLPIALLVVALTTAAVLLLVLTSKLTFFVDEWAVLLHRRGLDLDALLDPHGEHLALGIVVVYKTIQATLGMDSLVPYAVVSILAFLVAVVVLFIWMRHRVGDWLALAGAIAVLFMGSAYEDLLSPFQIGYSAALACGVGALLALERRDRFGDLLAAGLLVVAISFQSLGLAFVAGAGLVIGLDGTLRRRGWIVLLPALLFALWYLGWGHTAPSQASFENFATAPAFVLDGVAASASSLLGLATPPGVVIPGAGDTLAWGRPLLAGLLFVAGLYLVRLGRIPRPLWVVAAIAVVVWGLLAVNATLFRSPEASRYQLVGAVFLLMCGAELARGVRPSPRAMGVTLVVLAAAVASNLTILHYAHDRLQGATETTRGNLAALEIAAARVAPDFVLTPENSGLEYFTLVDAGSYLSAAEAFDSPAYTSAELESAPEGARVGADKVLVAALPVELNRYSGPLATGGPAPTAILGDSSAIPGRPECVRVDPSEFGVAVISLPPGDALLRAGAGRDGALEVLVRRYASESFSLKLGDLAAGRTARVAIPTDLSDEPWELQLLGSEPFVACGGGGP
jgi:hypothetical protein